MRSQHRPSRNNLPEGMPINGELTRAMKAAKEVLVFRERKYGPTTPFAGFNHANKKRITLPKLSFLERKK